MSKALSTFPGFSYPASSNPSANDTTWLGKYVEATAAVSLPSGAVIPLPLLFWETRALVLHGIADAEAVDALVLGERGLRARHVDSENLYAPAVGTGKASVDIWAPDYAGFCLGALKSVFATIAVQPRPTCPEGHAAVPHVCWWWYYGNSVVNHEFKRDVWGVPNQLGSLEMLYRGNTKSVRLLENGRVALRLKLGPRPHAHWTTVAKDSDSVAEDRIDERLHEISEQIGKPGHTYGHDAQAPFTFVAVANRKTDDGENEVQILGARMTERGSRDDGLVPYDASKHDEFFCGTGTAVDKHLKDIGFTPVAWDFYTTYNGVVKIYDAKGRATPPERPAEEPLKTIAKSLADLLPLVRKMADE